MTTSLQALDMSALAQRYLDAWEAHDVDAIVALHTADSQFQSHGRIQAVAGREALRAEFARVLAFYPGFGCETHRLLFGPAHWVLDWTLTFDSEDGTRRGFHCLDIVEVSDDGLVSRKDTFFDHAQAKAAVA